MQHANTWFSVAAVLTATFVACSDEGSGVFDGAGSGGLTATGGSGGAGANAGGNAGAPVTANGGASSAGMSAGGSSAAGMAGGGGAGAGAGGSAGTAVAGSGGGLPTSGCGATTWPKSDQSYTLDVAGVAREYIVSLPTNYASSTPYRLVFAWHGRTGTAAQIARNFYGLKMRGADSTIFVAGQGLGTDADAADTGWPNTNGRDVAFVRALVDSLGQSLCIDRSRIFSVGMSYGGIMSHTLGCQMGDVFRAIAPIAGAFFGGGRGAPECTGAVAAWMAHGSADEDVTPENGATARDLWLTQNGCGEATAPAPPSPCVAYEGCSAGHPVHWCLHPGAHIVPSFAAEGVWNFFTQF